MSIDHPAHAWRQLLTFSGPVTCMSASGNRVCSPTSPPGCSIPAQFITHTVTLGDTPGALEQMGTGTEPGVTMIRP